MKSILLDANNDSILKSFINALSIGGVGAFFVLIFAVLLIFFGIVKSICRPCNAIPIKLILSLTTVIVLLFTSMAFYIVIHSENGGRQKKTDPKLVQLTSSNDSLNPVYFASLNYLSFGCEKRAIDHKVSFVSSKPYYILIDESAPDEPNNQLALLSIDDNQETATFRIGQNSEFKVRLKQSVKINGGKCNYLLVFERIGYNTESVLFKRMYAHYTLNPI